MRSPQFLFPRVYVISEYAVQFPFSFRGSGTRFLQIVSHFFDERTSLVFLCPLAFRRLRRVLPSCVIMILLWRFLCSSCSKFSSFLSRLTTTHPSRQRSLSILFEVASSSTFHVSFVQPPHRRPAASVVWIWNTDLLWPSCMHVGHAFHQYRTGLLQ